MMRKIAAFVCGLVMLFSLSACKPNGQDSTDTPSTQSGQQTESKVSVTLPYTAKDLLNPYLAKTKQNQELSNLLYDPLIKVDDSFEPIYFLAEKVEQTNKKIVVRLRSATFTDGAPVTSDDVIYSIKQAKADGSNYRSRLSNIVNCYAVDSLSLVIEIGHADPYYINNLDFPVIKSGTASLKNENNISVAPIGCGRYTLQSGKGYFLAANKNYYRGDIKLDTIELVDCPDEDSLSHYLSIGKISLVYSDLSDSVIPKLTGATTKTPSTCLVYLGVNSHNGLLSDPKMRMAISFGVDRKAVCNNAYFGYAQPATSLFHPKWSSIGGLESIDSLQNINLAVAYLEDLGYNTLDTEGYRLNEKGERLTLRLLYNSENSARAAAANKITAQLKKCGLAVEQVSADFNEYRRLLETGSFDIYIGEVRLSNSMDLYPVLIERAAVYGMPEQSQAAAAFLSYYSGESDLLSAVSAFVSEMPFIPLCYRDGVILSDKKIAQVISYSPSDLYNNIESLK